MDNALLTNMLLFLGALGISFALDGGSRDEEDRPEDEADDSAAPTSESWVEEDMAADRNTLAWFLQGEDGVTPLAADDAVAVQGDDADTQDDDRAFFHSALSAGQEDSDGDALTRTDPEDETGHADADDGMAQDETAHDDSEGDSEGDGRGEVEAEVPDDGYAEITGYTAGDHLELEYAPVTGADGQPLPPVFEVQHSEDGSTAALVLDNQTIAMVSGPDVAGLKPEDVTLIAV